MNVTRAVVTAAGPGQRTLPLQTLVDRDGVEKKALEIVLDEVADAGVEEACLVVAPGDEAAYRAAGPHAPRLTFVEQPEPREHYTNSINKIRPGAWIPTFVPLLAGGLARSVFPSRLQSAPEGTSAPSAPLSLHLQPAFGNRPRQWRRHVPALPDRIEP